MRQFPLPAKDFKFPLGVQKKPEIEKQSTHRAVPRRQEQAGTGAAARFQTTSQAPQARTVCSGEPDLLQGHFRLRLLLPAVGDCFRETRHPEGQSPKGTGVLEAAGHGEAEQLPRLPGRGGAVSP